MTNYYQRIKQQYQNRMEDSTELFQTVLSVADTIGLDQTLAYLEQCVIEKRLAWLDENLEKFNRTGNAVLDGYRLFYEVYLGVSVPADGEIVKQTDSQLITRWWNRCPTLDACQKLGLDTREFCRKAYHQPVQIFLAKLDPRLRFERNYEALRPHTAYCEEIITLEE
ncbi:MAG: hypothetical protein JXM69_05015 [Anaerolineae bacterium]|nr:hypothetical protein [Anaerolineae bacterium]